MHASFATDDKFLSETVITPTMATVSQVRQYVELCQNKQQTCHITGQVQKHGILLMGSQLTDCDN